MGTTVRAGRPGPPRRGPAGPIGGHRRGPRAARRRRGGRPRLCGGRGGCRPARPPGSRCRAGRAAPVGGTDLVRCGA